MSIRYLNEPPAVAELVIVGGGVVGRRPPSTRPNAFDPREPRISRVQPTL